MRHIFTTFQTNTPNTQKMKQLFRRCRGCLTRLITPMLDLRKITKTQNKILPGVASSEDQHNWLTTQAANYQKTKVNNELLGKKYSIEGFSRVQHNSDMCYFVLTLFMSKKAMTFNQRARTTITVASSHCTLNELRKPVLCLNRLFIHTNRQRIT